MVWIQRWLSTWSKPSCGNGFPGNQSCWVYRCNDVDLYGLEIRAEMVRRWGIFYSFIWANGSCVLELLPV